MRELLQKLAGEAGETEVGSAGEVTEYRRSGRVFAVSEDRATEVRLGAEIADAARRTPDTHASVRGEDWVRFAPREWDKHATDRLEAWFRVAWRAAGHSD